MDASVFCDTCGNFFAAKYKLLDHIKNAQNYNEYPCDDCNKTSLSSSLSTLKTHKESIHHTYIFGIFFIKLVNSECQAIQLDPETLKQ